MEGGDRIRFTRRNVLKAGAGAVLLGGAVATMNDDGTDESVAAFPGVSYAEMGSRNVNGGVRTIGANRGVGQIGMAVPKEGHVKGSMCGSAGDGSQFDGEGYVEHRFVASHLSYGYDERLDFGGDGVTGNKYAECRINATPTAGEMAGCGSVELVPHYQVLSRFPIEPFFSGTVRPLNPEAQLRTLRQTYDSSSEPALSDSSASTYGTLLAVGGVGASGASLVTAATSLSLGLGPAGWTVVGLGFGLASLANAVSENNEPVQDFVFDGERIVQSADHQDSSGLFYFVDFSVRVPYDTAAVVNVNQAYDWQHELDYEAIRSLGILPHRICPVKSTRIQIPAVDPESDFRGDDSVPAAATPRPLDWHPTSDESDPAAGPGIETTAVPAFDFDRRVLDTDGEGSDSPLRIDPSASVLGEESPTNGVPFVFEPLDIEGIEGPPLMNFEWRLSKDGWRVDADDRSGREHDRIRHSTRIESVEELEGTVERRLRVLDSRSPLIRTNPSAVELDSVDDTFRIDLGPTAIDLTPRTGPIQFPSDGQAEAGFYTMTLTARNDDGVVDRMSRDFAVDKPILPLIDFPEPLPVDNAVAFRGYVTGPRADEVDVSPDSPDWQWTVTTLDRGNVVDTGTGTRATVTFERAVAHRVTLTVQYAGDEDPVTRYWIVRPSVEGPVVNVYADERPIPVGREVTLSTEIHYPDDQPPGNVTPTWTIRAGDGETELTTVVDGQQGNDLTHVFEKRTYEIRAALEETTYDWTPSARETVLPDFDAGGPALEIAGPDVVDVGDTATFRARFQGQDGVEEWPPVVRSLLPDLDVVEEKLGDPADHLVWTVAERGGKAGDGYPVENVAEIDHTFGEDQGLYVIKLALVMPVSWGQDDGPARILSTSKQVSVENPAADLSIEGPTEVPPGVEVSYGLDLDDVGKDVERFEWVVENDRGETTTYGGPLAFSIHHSFTDVDEATVRAFVETPDGDLTDTLDVTVSDDAAVIEGPARTSTEEWQTFELVAGADAATVTQATWSIEFANGESVNVGSPGGSGNVLAREPDSETVRELLFRNRDRYDVTVEATVETDGGTTTVHAAKRVAVTHHPAAVEISLHPPEDCRDPSVGVTTFSIDDPKLDGNPVPVFTLEDSNWRVRDEFDEVELEHTSGELELRSRDCHASAIRYPFDEVPESTSVAFDYTVDPHGGEPAIPYVAFYADGEKVYDSASAGGEMATDVRNSTPELTTGAVDVEYDWDDA